MNSNPSNIRYFIELSRSRSISEAAEKLHISHQSLSKYIRNLERQYQTTFFLRNPQLTLTEAGRALLESFQEISRIEDNLQNQLQELRHAQTGGLRIGMPEGRYRILLPAVVPLLKQEYPLVHLEAEATPAFQLQKKLLKNEMDVVLIDKVYAEVPQFQTWSVLDENLYLVVSENLLKKQFGTEIAEQVERFQGGADIRDFLPFPFILNKPNSISRQFLDPWLQSRNIRLQVAIELAQLDVHILLAARDFGACFCWGMYLPQLKTVNRLQPENPLHAFPLSHFYAHNQVVLASLKNRYLPSYGRRFCQLVAQQYRNQNFYGNHTIRKAGKEEEPV